MHVILTGIACRHKSVGSHNSTLDNDLIKFLLGQAKASPTPITPTRKSLYLWLYVCMYMYVCVYVAVYCITVNFRGRKLSRIRRKWEFHRENFHGLLETKHKWWWLSNLEIYESFLPRKFPTIRHYACAHNTIIYYNTCKFTVSEGSPRSPSMICICPSWGGQQKLLILHIMWLLSIRS